MSVKNSINDDVLIRDAKKDDMQAVSAMIKELAAFEKMPEKAKISSKELQRDGFDTPSPSFRCKVAEWQASEQQAQSSVIGYALYFNTYSTWEGCSMMLEDLYVCPEHRRKGVGKKLFKAVAKEATDSGCSRLDFNVLEWNDARSFYEAVGAQDLSSEHWCRYRLSGDPLRQISQS